MGYAKINKRHAQESMMKKKVWTHEGPKNSKKRRVGHMMVQVFKEKKIEKEIAHVQRKKERER